ncbi:MULTISPECIES: lipopolysaccharide biosynthesis protein [unclassified Janthinobacterium]|uniref:lipopolysaccharide biosynthesis protein n=1 Tax=unclassified Janthinobacterium TaxID=2610881 RepID=UPI0025B1287C|nr:MULTISPECIES: lipopolysaccharide biosynthesis protein [unclassified Janthinobacterium]MDN2716171.1 lipopolysaccharide biosynthesis protein [Janthinobacterium sp. SUN120]MDO8038363.1 lipopolysaccharide biosynthesis protein [Janthinobacterium sp. SUN137]
METQEKFTQRTTKQDGSLISPTELLSTLWHARRMIIGMTVACIALGVSSTVYWAKYKSEGFLQFGGPIPLQPEKTAKTKDVKEAAFGIQLSDYKRYSAAFGSSGRFDDFVHAAKLDNTPGIASLRKNITSEKNLNAIIEPIFPFTKLDAKDLMEQPKENSNNVIGLRINYDASTPEEAQRIVALLGRYTMDTIVYLIYTDSLRFKHLEITAKITKLDNDIIGSKQKLAEYGRRIKDLKQIVARYPKADVQNTSQVVTVTDENSRYLSPVTQLMSAEVEASAAEEAIYQAKREQQQYLLLRDYYDSAKATLDANKSGEAVLRALEGSKERAFKSKDLNDELVKEVYNKITVENQNSLNLYLEKSRFIAGPSLPENRTTRLSTSLVISALLGLFLGCLIALGRQWWIANREQLAD